MKPKKRVVFLMSDTGGGHRAAADAIRAAMEQRYPGQYAYQLIDVYRRYTPFPFNFMPEIYPQWVNRSPLSWGLSLRFIDSRSRNRLVMAAINQMWKRGIRRMVDEHPADVLVSVHSLFNRPAMRALEATQLQRPPFVTVVTDLVSTPAFWYEPRVERCLVPTQTAYDRGRHFGMQPQQMRITGLPVHPQFVAGLLDKDAARQKLGWDPHKTAVLLVGGGDGMGPVYGIASEINRRRLDIQLVIIAGRNRFLQRRLEAVRWHQPARIYPFVTNMPELMAAADILVTKAGPATICEACIAGLPIILSGAVPGQEDGNVTYVVENGAGVFAPGAVRVADTLAAWLADGPDMLGERAARARALGRPNAAWEIAEEIHVQAQRAPIRTRLGAGTKDSDPTLRPAPEEDWVI
ncbi:MAG TPA: glycosyltransferase [Aggregatilineaceae bacterium]|nr:galactosyldiacylglycerol synthase [Anaerolineae bacterium]HMM29937.1 glycosyltransferase [Aggregatilineaceae bacterium]